MSDQKDFYSPDDVAERLGLHVRTIRRFIREGKLHAVRIGKQYRIASQDFSAFVGSGDPQNPNASVGRRRKVMVSTTVDIDAISQTDSSRISTTLTAVFGSSHDERSTKSLQCIYYEEQGRLRIVINADLEVSNGVLGLIGVLLNADRGD
jgi:excisionase family DNA binding protein